MSCAELYVRVCELIAASKFGKTGEGRGLVVIDTFLHWSGVSSELCQPS